MAALIARLGPFRPVITPDPLRVLVGSILQQQVSVASASKVFARLRRACPGRRIAARGLLSLSPAKLRELGLSRQKAEYMHVVATAFARRELTPTRLRRMTDAEVLAATTRLKGIGRWTAEMLLIFCLEREDIWPVDDLVLRKGLQRFFDMPAVPTARECEPLGDDWRPYRTYATWYLWRSLEGALMPGVPI